AGGSGGAGEGARLERADMGPAGAARGAGRRGGPPSLMTWVPAEPWVRNQYVMVATVFVVFTGFAFVLPFLPLYVRMLGVRGDEAVALWSGVLVGIAPSFPASLRRSWAAFPAATARSAWGWAGPWCYWSLSFLSPPP